MLSTNELSPYYDAIYNYIRLSLESMAKSMDRSMGTGFDWPVQNTRCRTPQYMFLETSVRPGFEMLKALYTPFGYVKLLAQQGYDKENGMISQRLLHEYDWDIKDVTGDVLVYYYLQDGDKIRGPWEFEKELNPGANCPSRLYIVQRVGQIHFTSEMGTLKPMFFSAVDLTPEQDNEDKAMVKKLSESKF
jgi:hypothetical protein